MNEEDYNPDIAHELKMQRWEEIYKQTWENDNYPDRSSKCNKSKAQSKQDKARNKNYKYNAITKKWEKRK